ncbi:MAG: hypothetical protein AAGA99_20120 [Actinomycetota bacterium]
MASFGQREVRCAAGSPTHAIRTLWTNVPMDFVVEVEPPDATGTWVERRSILPAGIGMNDRSNGPVAAQMTFRRRYLDSSYEVEVTTDRPATLRIRRA